MRQVDAGVCKQGSGPWQSRIHFDEVVAAVRGLISEFDLGQAPVIEQAQEPERLRDYKFVFLAAAVAHHAETRRILPESPHAANASDLAGFPNQHVAFIDVVI